jgi:hypothetical protein
MNVSVSQPLIADRAQVAASGRAVGGLVVLGLDGPRSGLLTSTPDPIP